MPRLQHQLGRHPHQQHPLAGHREVQALEDPQAAVRQVRPAQRARVEDQQLHRGERQHQEELQHRGGEGLPREPADRPQKGVLEGEQQDHLRESHLLQEPHGQNALLAGRKHRGQHLPPRTGLQEDRGQLQPLHPAVGRSRTDLKAKGVRLQRPGNGLQESEGKREALPAWTVVFDPQEEQLRNQVKRVFSRLRAGLREADADPKGVRNGLPTLLLPEGQERNQHQRVRSLRLRVLLKKKAHKVYLSKAAFYSSD